MDWDLTTQKGMAKLIVIATSLSFEICTFYSLSWTHCRSMKEDWILYSNHLRAYVTVYRKTGHNAACVNIEKRSIDFLKMYCFKPTEGNG